MLKINRTIAADDPRAPDARHFAENLRHAITTTSRDQPVEGLARIAGVDASDTVTCFVDVHGNFVDLSFRSDWWYTAGPSGIASAVLDALAFAQEKSAIARVILGHYQRLAEDREPIEPSSSTPVPINVRAEIAAASERLRRADAIVDAAERMSRRLQASEQRVVEGPRGLFRVTLAGFTLQQADVAGHALSPDNADLLVEDARAALLRATRENDPRYWLDQEAAA
jgi:hypothetical protein